MKILLVIPHPGSKRSFLARFNYPSLTLKQLVAITPPGHEIDIIDERYEPIDFSKHYDLVGISCLTYNSIRGYEVAAEFKKKGIPTVMGGYHATLMPHEAKRYVDSVVVGEGEYTWPKVVEDVGKGQLKPFYRPDKFIPPEEIPAANHDVGTYNPFSEPIQASRGCPTGCEFCAMNVMEGRVFRGRPVDHLIEEMKSFKTRNIFFSDASLTVNPKYSKELFKGMAELNKKSEAFANVNVVSRDDEFLNLAKEAGIYNWYVGIESISQENINQAGKGTNKIEYYSKAIKKIRDHGMMITGFFMFGFDFDNTETFEKTLEKIYEWGFDEVSFSVITPYPGTRLYDRFEKEGRITCRDWSQYHEGKVNYKPTNLTERQIIDGMRMMALDFYSYPNIIKRSFSHNKLNLYRAFFKLLKNVTVRNFYLTEKLTH